MALGELSLDAAVTGVMGILNAALAASEQGRGLICPSANGPEAAFASGIEILATPSLIALVNHMKGASVLSPPEPRVANPARNAPDLHDVKGQESAKRALEIAAAGGDNLLMIGPPGAGKSMLDQRLPGLLPALDACEALEISMIQSLAGALEGGAISRTGRCAIHIIPLPWRPWSGAASRSSRGKCRSRIWACCSWMNCRSSSAACWTACVSRSRPARRWWRAPTPMCAIPRGSSWWRR